MEKCVFFQRVWALLWFLFFSSSIIGIALRSSCQDIPKCCDCCCNELQLILIDCALLNWILGHIFWLMSAFDLIKFDFWLIQYVGSFPFSLSRVSVLTVSRVQWLQTSFVFNIRMHLRMDGNITNSVTFLDSMSISFVWIHVLLK